MSRPRSLVPKREVKRNVCPRRTLCAYMCPLSSYELVSHKRSRLIPALSLFCLHLNPPLLTIHLLFPFFIAFLEYILNISISLRREIIGSFSSFFLPFFPFRYAALKFLSLFRTYSLFSWLPFLPWCPFIPTPHWDSILTEKIDSRERQEFCPRRNRRRQRIVASPQNCRRQQYWIIWWCVRGFTSTRVNVFT